MLFSLGGKFIKNNEIILNYIQTCKKLILKPIDEIDTEEMPFFTDNMKEFWEGQPNRKVTLKSFHIIDNCLFIRINEERHAYNIDWFELPGYILKQVEY